MSAMGGGVAGRAALSGELILPPLPHDYRNAAVRSWRKVRPGLCRVEPRVLVAGMLTLYHAPRSRSSRIIWLLEELGAPYQIRITGIPRPDGPGAPDAANPHPDKKVPALVDHGALHREPGA